MAKRTVLLVDDEQIMRESIREALVSNGYQVTVAHDGAMAKEMVQRSDYHVVLSDIRMPGLTGVELLKYIKEVSPDTLVILMTAFGTIESAIDAMREGAFDYVTKPFSIDTLEVVMEKAFSHRELIQENRYLKSTLEKEFDLAQFVGEHATVKTVVDVVRKVAASRATVLVTGESGTGKELVARALHYLSPRKNKPFIKVNCAALSATLLESELFGHEKGAFTGAYAKKVGRFELADGGTLLLDEIGEIDIALQAKLLRVLQEKEFERVGGVTPLDIDVRVVATTNRDLEKAVREGKFREDLYYRLNVVPIKLPSLRERKTDIPLLMDYFLEQYAQENGKRVHGFSPEVYQMLMAHDWPGNVRELENAIERAIVLTHSSLLTHEYFDTRGEKSHTVPDMGTHETKVIFPHKMISLYELEKQYIYHALAHFRNNKTRAAEALEVSVRTLRNKLDEYNEKECVTA